MDDQKLPKTTTPIQNTTTPAQTTDIDKYIIEQIKQIHTDIVNQEHGHALTPIGHLIHRQNVLLDRGQISPNASKYLYTTTRKTKNGEYKRIFYLLENSTIIAISNTGQTDHNTDKRHFNLADPNNTPTKLKQWIYQNRQPWPEDII